MTKVLEKLFTDPEARAIVHRANRRSRRYGAGDNMDFALFVVDETRKAEKEKMIAHLINCPAALRAKKPKTP